MKYANASPASEFITWVEGYYGKYPEGQRLDIAEYLSSMSESYLIALKACLKHSYSSQYRIPPDIATFDKLYGDVITEQGKAVPALPAPSLNMGPEETKGAQRLLDDLKYLGITMDTPDFMTRVLKLRQDRGDYKQDAAKYHGGVIHNMDDITKPKQGVSWGELGMRHEREGARV